MAKTDKKREVHVYADWHGLNGPEYIKRQRDLRQKDERGISVEKRFRFCNAAIATEAQGTRRGESLEFSGLGV
jgi:hypothetical protein